MGAKWQKPLSTTGAQEERQRSSAAQQELRAIPQQRDIVGTSRRWCRSRRSKAIAAVPASCTIDLRINAARPHRTSNLCIIPHLKPVYHTVLRHLRRSLLDTYQMDVVSCRSLMYNLHQVSCLTIANTH